eukprot:1137163-Pelagomonas_calceolata.AAC.2
MQQSSHPKCLPCGCLSQCQESLLLDFTPFVRYEWLHAHSFQQEKRYADPMDLSQLVVDLRSRHLTYWRQFSSSVLTPRLAVSRFDWRPSFSLQTVLGLAKLDWFGYRHVLLQLSCPRRQAPLLLQLSCPCRQV